MTLDQLLTFSLFLFAALISPGAAFLLSIQTTVAYGRRAGLATGAGLATMAALWTLSALLGLKLVFAAFPWAYSTLKIGGALYLLYLAVKIWRGADATLGQRDKPGSRAFLEGVLVNLGNPKSVLFAGALIVLVFPQGLAAGEVIFIATFHFLVELAFYGACAWLLSAPLARARYLKLKPILDRAAALLLGALGLRLLLQR